MIGAQLDDSQNFRLIAVSRAEIYSMLKFAFHGIKIYTDLFRYIHVYM